MSATLHLFKVVPNVSYVGSYWDTLKRSDIEEKKGVDYFSLPWMDKAIAWGCPRPPKDIENCSSEAFDRWDKKMTAWENEQMRKRWSDGIDHREFDLLEIKKNYYDVFCTLKSLYNPKPFSMACGFTTMSLPVEEIWYSQGWFFTKSFFKLMERKERFVTLSKERMVEFLRKYIDMNYNKKKGTHYYELEWIVKDFADRWEDGMIFMASF